MAVENARNPSSGIPATGRVSYYLAFSRVVCVSRGIRQSLTAGVVRRLGGHDDVVRMGFAQASVGDADEATTFRHFGDVVRANVEHGLVQAADHLVQHGVERSAVRASKK